VIRFIHPSVFHPEFPGQLSHLPQPRRGRFRARIQDPLGDHSDDQVATTLLRGNQSVDAQATDHARNRLDVVVREGADDLEALLEADQRFVTQDPPQRLDFPGGPMGDVGYGVPDDRSAFPTAFTQKDVGTETAVGDDVDVKEHHLSPNTPSDNPWIFRYMGTYGDTQAVSTHTSERT